MEAKQEAARYIPGKCAPFGSLVGSFVCTPVDLANINLLLAKTAFQSLVPWNRTPASRMAFCSAFGYEPDFAPDWLPSFPTRVPGLRNVAEFVAVNLQDAADVLANGCFQYFSWGGPSLCPNCAGDPRSYVSCSGVDQHSHFSICLGGQFWQEWQAGDTTTMHLSLIHEPLATKFGVPPLPPGSLGDAYCYESFGASVKGLPVPQHVAQNCSAKECPPLPVLGNFRVGSPKPGRLELEPHHAPLIRQVAESVVSSWGTAVPLQAVQLTGFTDWIGDGPDSVQLGLSRALAAQQALAAAIRILDPGVANEVTLVPLSRGADGAIASNTIAAGRAQNRRVEIMFVP